MPKKTPTGRSGSLSTMNKGKKKTQAKAASSGSFKHKSSASTNPYRPDPSGGKPGSRFRTRATINRLNMYN